MLEGAHFSLTQLEYIMAVHKHGHFAKAAQACHVTQPTLSMQVQKLEEDLGVVIFDRSKKPILLTEVGKKLIEQIQVILFEAKKIKNIIKDTQAGVEEGQLNLGIIPTIAPYALPRMLPVLQKSFPLLELNIKEMQTDHILQALENDELDVGLLATPTRVEKIHEVPLYYETFSVLCHRRHEYSSLKKIKYSQLNLKDIWLLEEGHCLRNQVMDLCSARKGKVQERKYKFESGSLETLKNLVDQYGGYTLVPTLATDTLGKNSSLIPFEKPFPAREIGLVFRREHYKSRLIELLGKAIQQSLPEEIRKVKNRDLDIIPI